MIRQSSGSGAGDSGAGTVGGVIRRSVGAALPCSRDAHAPRFPAPGQILIYPGGISEMEILVPYGSTHFASKVGQLAGNHFATVTEGSERLADLGRLVLWEGAQDFRIRQ